jgi:SecD-like export protein
MRQTLLALLFLFSAIQPLSAQLTTAVLKGENLQQTSIVIAARLAEHGATHITIMRSDSYLMVSFKDLTDADIIAKVLAGSRIEFRYRDDQGNWQTALTNADLSSASPTEQDGFWSVQLETTESGKKNLADVTRKLLDKRLSIFVDDKEISSPIVREAITGGSVMITGRFTRKEASDLAESLNSGAELLELSSDDS